MNFYQYLGVKETASTDEIRKAFRKMAKVTHPDYNKKRDAFWEMVELNIIRDTLLNPEKRKKYDESLKTGKAGDFYPTTTHSKPPYKEQKKSSIYKSVKNLFIYRCKVCGHEMSSTWRGFCLYHYLEATGQLDNDDFIFTYGGQHYQWTDPPEELRRKRASEKNTPRGTITLTPLHVGLYISLLVSIAMILLVLIVTYI